MAPCNNDPHADPRRAPRHSNPLSFLSKRAFAVAALAMMSFAATETTAAAGNDCVCNYDPDVDYFPNKIAPNYSANFQIEYFKSYKKITLIKGEERFVTFAYLCGTPVPDQGHVNNTIEIPIKSAAVTATSFVPFIEYMNERESLHFVSAAPTDLKSCLRKMYDEGKVATGFSFGAEEMLQANQSAYARTGDALDVVFMDDYNYNSAAKRETLLATLGPRTKAIFIGEQLETTPLGKLEWVEVMAALYNKEHQVLNVATRLNSRYNCVKNLVTATPPTPRKKKVLWGNCFFSTYTNMEECYVAVCPSYNCDLIKDAGGEVLASDFFLNVTQMYDLAAQADVWIYVDGNWNRSSPYSTAFFAGDNAAKFANLPVVQNKQVYDILGKPLNDWFEDAKAEPGVVLMDLVQAINGDQYIDRAARSKDFLRNVFTEPMADQGERLASACTDPTAPLYTGWDEGFCSLPASTVVVPNADKTLCVGGSSDAGLQHAIHVMPLALFVAMLAMLLGA